jgi:hypothetical protein
MRFGRVRAAVWLNESEAGTWASVTVSRLYKDKEDKWQDTTSFSRDDLPLLIKVVDRVHSWLYQQGEQGDPVK